MIRAMPCLGVVAGIVLAAAVQTAAADGDGFHFRDVELQAWLDLDSFGPGSRSGSSCWGYTSPSGREYAIVGLSDSTAFVEVTKPTNPAIIGKIDHPESAWCEIKTYRHYAYISNETGGGLQIVDMGKIDQGFVNLLWSATPRGLSTSHTVTVNDDSGKLYLNGSNIDGGGLTILSLANPMHPEWIGAYDATYVHDSQVVTYHDGPYAGREIAFCFAGYKGLDIVDVTDPQRPIRLSRSTYPGQVYSHQGWLSEDRRFLYLDDELDELNLGWPTLTRVFDVSDLEHPVLMNEFGNGVECIDHNQFVKDRFLFQSNYTSGLRVWDISDPIQPTEVAWFDTYPEDDDHLLAHDGDVIFNGTWSNFPYFRSGNVAVSDIDRGLFILKPRPFTLSVTDLHAGRHAAVAVTNATPGYRVWFAGSLVGEGETYVGPLRVTIGLESPILLGVDRAGQNGSAHVAGRIPSSMAGRDIWIQAAEMGRASIVIQSRVE